MKFSLLLLVLYQKLKKASKKNVALRAKILIKTAGGSRGRLFVFDKGKIAEQITGFLIRLALKTASTWGLTGEHIWKGL